jgi:hypothetical protein
MKLASLRALRFAFISSINISINKYLLFLLIALLTCSLTSGSEANVSSLQENSSEPYPMLVLILPSHFQASAGDILNISYLMLNNGNYTLMNVSLATEESGPVKLNKSIILPRQTIGGIESILLTDSDFSRPIIRKAQVSAKDPRGKIIALENSTSIELKSRA